MGLFSAIGTAVGGVFGGPAGAAIGGAIGGAIDGQKAEGKQTGGTGGFNLPANFDFCMCQASFGRAQRDFEHLRSGDNRGDLARRLDQIEQSLNQIERQLQGLLSPTPHCGDRGQSDDGVRELLGQLNQLRGDISELRGGRDDDFCHSPHMHHHRFDDGHYLLRA